MHFPGVESRLEQCCTQAANGDADDGSFSARLSPDGHHVSFASQATDLVAGDVNVSQDVFIRDRRQAGAALASVNTGGFQANGASSAPSAVSVHGQDVAFSSLATNLDGSDISAARPRVLGGNIPPRLIDDGAQLHLIGEDVFGNGGDISHVRVSYGGIVVQTAVQVFPGLFSTAALTPNGIFVAGAPYDREREVRWTTLGCPPAR